MGDLGRAPEKASISLMVGAARLRKAMPIASAGRLWLVFPSQRGDPMFHSSISKQFRNFQLEIGYRRSSVEEWLAGRESPPEKLANRRGRRRRW